MPLDQSDLKSPPMSTTVFGSRKPAEVGLVGSLSRSVVSSGVLRGAFFVRHRKYSTLAQKSGPPESESRQIVGAAQQSEEHDGAACDGAACVGAEYTGPD